MTQQGRRGRGRAAAALAAAATAAVTLAACGGSTSSASGTGSSGGSTAGGGSVAIGESTTLSGSIAELGQTGLQGLQMAVDDLNAKGGLLGKKITVVSADDNATPSTGASNARNMILNDHVVALFGPVSSAVAAAEEQLAAQYHTLIFFHTSNDSGLMTKSFTKYAFQLVPNTDMEPRAAALYLAKEIQAGVVKPPLKVGTFAPDYSFGHDSVTGFVKALGVEKVPYQLVSQQFPALEATDISSNLSALLSKSPDVVYNAQFGGDLVTFVKEAAGSGFFQKTKMLALLGNADLKALGSSSPAGSISFDRAPWWAMNSPGVTDFANRYHSKYSDWPSQWAILAYTSVQTWADGVKKAGSFDADKVSAAISGATVDTIRGPVTIRACDHQAEVPEYVGTVASQPDPKTGYPLWVQGSAFAAPFSQISLTCAEAQSLRSGS